MSRSKSSSRWLQEHRSDFYVQKSKADGFRSRAVYKLMELDEKDRIIKPHQNIIDLGAAPGGWTEYVSQKLKISEQDDKGCLIAVDILEMDPVADTTIIQGDFTEQVVLDQVLELVDNQKMDVVLSDMAPNISGLDSVDQPKAMYLAELALDLCQQVLDPKGCFAIKLFHGVGMDEYTKLLRQTFKKVVFRKPSASRSRSREVYAVCRGLK
ncbi:MAG: 23S rRNA (uridine(2552)-2'-O)-methyltransferase RlmE [Gammaproteobacteria bacterium]|nr:23S rRNA (uridine(2552)-2'-O)-methyltransferase RlmE [Gammaproteobacteria bacterium]